MDYPEIGEIITSMRAVKLCRDMGLDYLAERILAEPENYISWKFDGCSLIPDELMGLLSGCDWRDITYKCCLPHDLCYAYGEPGNDIERRLVDIQFKTNLMLEANMPNWCAHAFHTAVSVGGAEVFGLSFSWGFARKDEE